MKTVFFFQKYYKITKTLTKSRLSEKWRKKNFCFFFTEYLKMHPSKKHLKGEIKTTILWGFLNFVFQKTCNIKYNLRHVVAEPVPAAAPDSGTIQSSPPELGGWKLIKTNVRIFVHFSNWSFQKSLIKLK